MTLFKPVYEKVLQWSKHRLAPFYLALLSFSESSFFPIPVDVMLAPMALAKRNKAWFYAFLATVTSVLGGLVGYFIGAFLFDSYGQQVLSLLHAHEKFEMVKQWYTEYGLVILFVAGFTPIPYKIFTIASGVVGIALLPFLLISLMARGARFFLVAGLIKLGGEKLETTIHQQVERLGWLSLLLIVVGVLLYKLFL